MIPDEKRMTVKKARKLYRKHGIRPEPGLYLSRMQACGCLVGLQALESMGMIQARRAIDQSCRAMFADIGAASGTSAGYMLGLSDGFGKPGNQPKSSVEKLAREYPDADPADYALGHADAVAASAEILT